MIEDLFKVGRAFSDMVTRYRQAILDATVAAYAPVQTWRCSHISKDWCSREELIGEILLKHVPILLRQEKRPNVDLQAIFDVGTAVHFFWQREYLGPFGILYGIWKTNCCNTYTCGPIPQKPVSGEPGKYHYGICANCGRPFSVEYEEICFSIPVPGRAISGHCDGVCFDNVDNGWRIVELKTMNTFQFKKLDAPLPAHVEQLNLYMHAMQNYPELSSLHTYRPELSKQIAASLLPGLIVYIDKNSDSGNIKTYTVKYNLQLANTLIDRVREANLCLAASDLGHMEHVLPDGLLEDSCGACKGAKCPVQRICKLCSTVGDVVEYYSGGAHEVEKEDESDWSQCSWGE